jgi:hypothetical protein
MWIELKQKKSFYIFNKQIKIFNFQKKKKKLKKNNVLKFSIWNKKAHPKKKKIFFNK